MNEETTARVSIQHRTARVHRGQAGFGMIELLSTMAIFIIIAGAGVLSFDSSRENINGSARQLAADLRFARARAMTTGEHFALRSVTSSSYQVERYEWTGTVWQLKEIVRQATLPSQMALAIPGLTTIEFDTRGEVFYPPATPPTAIYPVLTDSKFGTSRSVGVWPSGQIQGME